MVQRTRNITDFNFSIDASNYVSQQWWRVAVMPSKKSQKAGEMITLRDALEQYTLSQKSIKEIVCQKQLVGWNFQELRDKIISVIYSTGYRSHISVVGSGGGSVRVIIPRWHCLELLGRQQPNRRSCVVQDEPLL